MSVLFVESGALRLPTRARLNSIRILYSAEIDLADFLLPVER